MARIKNFKAKAATSEPATARPPGQYVQPPRGNNGQLAPAPGIDKYPTIIGSSLTLTYLSSVYRSAQTGYRREYVDVLDELLERDPHAFAVLSQRILGVAGGKLTMKPAKCDDSDEERAKEIADDCEQAIHGIESLQQSLAALLWGIYYGVSASEINWGLLDGKWSPTSLSNIHSRRLAYPSPNDWTVRIWDLGMAWGWGNKSTGTDPTSIGFGLSPADFPGKFIVHAPQLRGNYPTRDGLGREIAYWMALKLMSARNFANFVERFGRPWPIGYYKTEGGKDESRAATDDDITALQNAVSNLGAGSLASAALPDCLRVDMGGPMGQRLPTELPQAQYIRICNAEVAKAVLGQSDTTEAGPNGARASTEIRKAGTIELYRYDSSCLCSSLKRDLIWYYVHLNYPGEEHLCPTPHIDVEPPPDREIESKIILNAVTAGAPVDADKAAHAMGIELIPNLTDKPRRLGLCIASDPSRFDDAITPPPTPAVLGTTPANDNADAINTKSKTDKPTDSKEAKPGVNVPAKADKKPTKENT